ncbi:endonuclease/exonuclease/phosphatase [Xylaria venustula]|nr:endonuclease/exonuclease/phosphatase [Xylaria venustula]
MSPLSLRVLTSNIRYAAPGDTYEKPWSVRGPLLIKTVSDLAASATARNTIPIIGMQEVLHGQLLDILTGLNNNDKNKSTDNSNADSKRNEEWNYIGTGRDDGDEKGEYCPILYQPGRAKLLSSTQKWLSRTPDEPSFWPGAGGRRYVLVAVFEDVRDGGTGSRFIVANTHLDNASSEARSEGVRIVLSVIRDVQTRFGPGLPVVLSGDLNSEPGQDAYEAVVKDGYLADSWALAGEGEGVIVGAYETYTGFDPGEIEDVKARIDFLWLGPTTADRWTVSRYEVVDNVVDGVFFSDHRPVFVDVALKI